VFKTKMLLLNLKKKNLNNLIKRKHFFEKTLRKVKSIANFYCYKF